MADRDEQLLKRLLAVFSVEAEEHLAVIAAGLRDLDQGGGDAARRQEAVEATFRAVHTLKGAARAVTLTPVVTLCHAMESVFAALKKEGQAPSAALLDIVHEAFALVRDLLPRDGIQPGRLDAGRQTLVDRVARQLEDLAGGLLSAMTPADVSPSGGGQVAGDAGRQAPPPEKPREETRPAAAGAVVLPPRQSIRISTAKLDALLRQAEELTTAKVAAGRLATELQALAVQAARELPRGQAAAGRGSISLDHGSQDNRALADRLSSLALAAGQDARALTKMVDTLLETTKEALIVPFSTLLESFPPFVRDFSRAAGKDTDLILTGESLEIDRRIQNEMKDAFIHLIRNAIDHGIEPPEERVRRGKPPRGRLSLTVTPHETGQAEVTIADDGGGIDVGALRETVRQAHLLPEGQVDAASEAEILSYVFRSGVSTSAMLTETSGRGLGLAIVQEKIEQLGGSIAIETEHGRGTAFRIRLPVSLASMRGVIVEANEAVFIIPTAHVERVFRVPTAEIQTIRHREAIVSAGRTLTLVPLAGLLDLPSGGGLSRIYQLAVVVTWAGESIALAVDVVRGEQEVLMKGLGPQLRRVRHVSGASVLADGRLALVLNVRDLVASASSSAPLSRPEARPAASAVVRKSILVAEDSITARTLFKHVLEAAGYRVKTAVDGRDAWGMVTAEAFDLVVSDVEMPHLSGFDLTARIRDDAALGGMPVILITSLGSREDRERGIDVGANAYVVKNNFDQVNFLRIVQSLL